MLIYALIALSTAPLVACKGKTSITRILKDYNQLASLIKGVPDEISRFYEIPISVQ